MQTFKGRLTVVSNLLVLLSCASCISSDDEMTVTKLSDLQVIGSHNSYKQAVEQPLLDFVAGIDPQGAVSLEYEHIPLKDQLDLGLRNLELDVFYDPEGGRYSNPRGLEIILESGNTPLPYDEDNELAPPGLKLFHVQDVDFRSHHLLFTNGLMEIKSWSDQNPDHVPIFVLINAQDEEIEGTLSPLPFTAEALASIDTEIRSVFTSEQLITPDLIRGNFESLEEAVLTDGWPLLEEVKGKILFVLDENNAKTALYLEKFPGLVNSSLFVNRPEGASEAAFMVVNDPIRDFDKIQRLVNKGYIVRTLADSETREARANDLTRFESAQASGAQIISTDYYIPSKLFESDYKVVFDDGSYERIKD
ncbi:MAG: phosphatidylinositol-specific phospholipase C1-like protein [Reichenbachiella sp.]|uniref:phosphatidylinositol-specific phospholipase C1-like protein n=1 Tax=Reichenbachiella sp. TaxID=2184521 RepID=UPI003266E181